jgi:tryptophan synthase alpha chain
MNRIQQKFVDLSRKNEKALVGFVTAGDPCIERSLEIILAMCRAGLDILELGIPFSDPTADGPAIQRSSERSLNSGTSTASVIEMIRSIRSQTNIPIILFGYYNPIFNYDCRQFNQDSVAAGADGVLVVDLPPEESADMTAEWKGSTLQLIRLVAPTSPPDRLALIAGIGEGFLYLVSKTGVTGSQGLDLQAIAQQVEALRCHTDTPICVGFGISTPEQVSRIAALADGVVVGSAFERLIEDNIDDPGLPELLSQSVQTLKAATRAR